MSELSVDPYDITVKSNGLRRRRIVEKVFGVLAIGSALLACGILLVVLGTLVYKGFSSLNVDFFTKARPLFGEKGGVADALVGSALVVGMAMLMAIPVSVLVAIYMSEYAGPKVSRGLKIVLWRSSKSARHAIGSIGSGDGSKGWPMGRWKTRVKSFSSTPV